MTTPLPDADDAVENSLVDALREDAGLLTEYPAGTPELTPFMELKPRSRRARFKRKFAECTALEDTVKDVQARAKKIAAAKKPTPELGALRLRLSADVDDLFGLMDEVLELAAVDPTAWRKWSDNLDDENDLARVFQLYMQRSQPGEASGSSS
jgi:hypothetical protein